MIKGMIFDFGNTLIYQVPDNINTLDKLEISLMPGAEECIKKLSQYFKIAILSNTETTTSEQLKIAIDNVGLNDLGIQTFTSVSLGVKKPNKLIYEAVLVKMNLSANETVMIGNDLVEDIEGAQRCGLYTIHIAKDDIESIINPDLRVSAVSAITLDLIKAISKINNNVTKYQKDKEVKIPHASICALNAINLEKKQEWRKIGLTWLECALEADDCSVDLLGGYCDPEATIHNFPYFDIEKWASLSNVERSARAFRYAGYHFQADGDRQSAYRLYRMSAKKYEEEKKFDEAGRSHFLALKSYIMRFGEPEKEYLTDLVKSIQISVNYDKESYLKRMIIYYRILDALLKSKGNYLASLEMKKKKVDAHRMLMKKPKTYHRFILSTVWSILTGYGQSVTRWFLTFLIFIFLIFPTIYKWTNSFTQDITFQDSLLFSISRVVNHNIFNWSPTFTGHCIIILQGIFILFWIGSLISILVARIQN